MEAALINYILTEKRNFTL